MSHDVSDLLVTEVAEARHVTVTLKDHVDQVSVVLLPDLRDEVRAAAPTRRRAMTARAVGCIKGRACRRVALNISDAQRAIARTTSAQEGEEGGEGEEAGEVCHVGVLSWRGVCKREESARERSLQAKGRGRVEHSHRLVIA